jgi:hypothetical protein
VFLYLEKVTNDTMIEKYYSKFEEIIKKSKYNQLDYFKYWMGYYFAKYTKFGGYTEIRKFIINSGNIRNYALFAKTNKIISWIRTYKNSLDKLGLWDRRAIILCLKCIT